MNTLKNFIVFEGIDGSGKSTQAKLLVDALNAKSIKAVLTAEPTQGEIGKMIRKYLKGEIELNEDTMLYLFAGDRNEHVKQIKELCDNGIKVICDRYIFSSLAYQSLTSGFERVYSINKDFPLPEITFFIDIDPEDSVKRLTTKERYDQLSDQKKVYRSYLNTLYFFKDEHRANVVKLDGNLSREELLEEELKHFLKED